MTKLLLASLAALLLSAACAGPTPERAEPRLGSSRGERVAVPADEARPLLYLTSVRDAARLAEWRVAVPEVRVIGGLDRSSALEHAADAVGADAHLLTEEFLDAAPNLRWVQAWSAGVDRYVGNRRLRDDETIVFTNMKGMHGPVIAEHVFALLLQHTRQLPRFAAAAERGEWLRDGTGMRALAGQTMLVVGMGGIGSEIARRANAFGMTVHATVRTARPAPDFVDRLGVAADLDAFLPHADFVVICVPLTHETQGLFDAARFAKTKPGAVLVNIARGRVVDTDALLAALASGHLAGACLDVTHPEPLPPDHPLWRHDDVWITPHVAARAELTAERRDALFAENLLRFGRGEPLRNVVDKQAGY